MIDDGVESRVNIKPAGFIDTEARFLFGGRDNNAIMITTTPTRRFLKTKTVASLVQTTFNSTATVYCIPLVQFAGSAYQTTCSLSGRKRRDMVSLIDMLQKLEQVKQQDQQLDDSQLIISPYQVEQSVELFHFSSNLIK